MTYVFEDHGDHVHLYSWSWGAEPSVISMPRPLVSSNAIGSGQEQLDWRTIKARLSFGLRVSWRPPVPHNAPPEGHEGGPAQTLHGAHSPLFQRSHASPTGDFILFESSHQSTADIFRTAKRLAIVTKCKPVNYTSWKLYRW